MWLTFRKSFPVYNNAVLNVTISCTMTLPYSLSLRSPFDKEFNCQNYCIWSSAEIKFPGLSAVLNGMLPPALQSVDIKNAPVYTSDRQTATVTFLINYSALPGEVENIYRNFATLDSLASRTLLRPAMEQIASVLVLLRPTQPYVNVLD